MVMVMVMVRLGGQALWERLWFGFVGEVMVRLCRGVRIRVTGLWLGWWVWLCLAGMVKIKIKGK